MNCMAAREARARGSVDGWGGGWAGRAAGALRLLMGLLSSRGLSLNTQGHHGHSLGAQLCPLCQGGLGTHALRRLQLLPGMNIGSSMSAKGWGCGDSPRGSLEWP